MSRSPASDRVEAYGIDAVCQDIVDGHTLGDIAKAIGVSSGTLAQWLAATPERSLRARDARRVTATLWDERAELAIFSARDAFELSKARELAVHYRWRSAKMAPADYGDKIDVGGKVDIKVIPDDKLEARLLELIGKAGIAAYPGGTSETQLSAEAAFLLP